MVRGKSRSRRLAKSSRSKNVSVRHIDLRTYAKISALLMVVYGLLMDVLVFFGASMGMEPYTTLHSYGLVGYASVFTSYFLAGFLSSLFMVFLYNVFARLVGGVRVEVE